MSLLFLAERIANQVALRKVVEWWFMNSANPEWNDIHQVLTLGKPNT